MDRYKTALRHILFFAGLSVFMNMSLAAIVWEIKQDGTGDFFNIQHGIDAAADSDTVLVWPGIYHENIDISGKDIVLSSLQLVTGDDSYIHSTIIDGSRSGSVVTFSNDVTAASLLNGFTIQNSFGRAVFLNYSSPGLKNLVVRNNFGSGIQFRGSNSYVENLTVTGNHSVRSGGGIDITHDSDPTFSSENKCNIYNNTGGFAADINVAYLQTIPVHVIVDTLTVLDPDWNYITPSDLLTVSIDNQWLEQVGSDLYVAPGGDDENSGLTPEEPLRSIQWALTKIQADSLNHRTIHLAPGVYSPAANDQLFPLNMRSYVTLKGAGRDYTFLEEPVGLDPARPPPVIYAKCVTDIGIRDLTIRNIKPVVDGDFRPARAIIMYEPDPGIKINAEISGFRLENCVNSGLVHSANGNLTIEDSEFINNAGNNMFKSLGRGDSSQWGDVYLNNLLVTGNQPYPRLDYNWTARISIARAKNVHISNSLIVDNINCSSWVPLAYVNIEPSESLTFTNNIVANNHTAGGVPGGAVSFGGGGAVELVNSIIYGNTQFVFILNRNSIRTTVVNISHSLIEGGTDPAMVHIGTAHPYGVEINWGEGIIDTPPMFLGEVEDGYEINDLLYYQPSAFSPYIDAGNPDTTGLDIPAYDLLYNQRIWDGLGDGKAIIDMGCFEYNAPEYTDIEEYIIQLPGSLTVMNYPNPFNPETTIAFTLPYAGEIELNIYNIRGGIVKRLLEGYREAGEYLIKWDGRDERGRPVSSGVYFYRITAGDLSEQRKMLLLK